jgi:hypothetical protein
MQLAPLLRGKEAEEVLGDGDALDETPCPPDITMALGDAAFTPPPRGAANAPPRDCGTPPPADLAKYVYAAAAGCTARGALRDADAAAARGEVLREVLAGGWLLREFITKQRQAHTAGNTNTLAVCAPETSRWLFEVVTDPASTREVGLYKFNPVVTHSLKAAW